MRKRRFPVVVVALIAIGLLGFGDPRALRTEASFFRAKNARLAASSEPRPPATYDDAVRDLVEARTTAKVLADAAPGSWTRRAKAVTAELAYANLTGDYDAYGSASAALDESFRVARRSLNHEAVGPLMLRAQLSYELHRMQDALDSLKAPEQHATYFQDKKQLAEIISLRGAVTFAIGKYDDGIALLVKAIELDPTAGHNQRLALALAKIGKEDEAIRLFDTQDSKAGPRSMAWIALQHAHIAMDHGQRKAARRHLQAAIKAFPGGWQAEEHLAELDAEEGREAEAIAAYRSLVQRTNDPEFMDALARLIDERSPEEARTLREQAHAIYEVRLARLPEAAYGHALEHFLKMVDDPSTAIAIALKNRDLRPDGEARTRLAQAYIRAGRFAAARAEMDEVLATSWTRTETWATAAIAHRLTGDSRGAQNLEEKARARNPFAMDEIAWLKPPLRL